MTQAPRLRIEFVDKRKLHIRIESKEDLTMVGLFTVFEKVLSELAPALCAGPSEELPGVKH